MGEIKQYILKMSKNKPTKQHYVPQCYLREFVDPKTPKNQEPYVWFFNRGDRKGRKKAPSNLFTETDLYTLNLKAGGKDYFIEETLSRLEGKYAEIFRTKIKNHIPISVEEHVYLCAFTSVMLQRTLRHRDSLNRFFDELIGHTEAMEREHSIEPKESEKLKKYRENSHSLGVIQTLPDITELLMKMGIAFLCAPNGVKFLTSDDPCNLFNPDLQWQRFYGPGLAQKNVQVTLPLSTKICLCLSWTNLRGYIQLNKDRAEEINRMIVGHCYQYFVSSSSKTQRTWFRKYPLDFFFILKILRHKFKMMIFKLKNKNRFRHVRRK